MDINSSIGERLAEERSRLGLNQSEAAQVAKDLGVPGATRQSQARYEKGQAAASAAYLAAVATAGFDTQYILTGQRSAVAQPDSSTYSSSLSIDRERLEIAVEAVMEGLSETRRKLPPNKMAELILAAYDLISDSEQSKENIIRLVRMAA